MTEDQTVVPGNDQMLYRKPENPDAEGVTEIWGKKLETKIVDANDVPAMLEQGWATHPNHIDNPPANVPSPSLSDALQSSNDQLQGDLDEARRALVEERERVSILEGDLKAAQDLCAEESKAKDAALARVAELEAAAKAKSEKLSIKTDKPS